MNEPSSPSLRDEMTTMGRAAATAARRMLLLSARRKNLVLEAMAQELSANKAAILAANARDMEAARAGGMGDAMLDRLLLTDTRFEAMVEGVRSLMGLRDPIGERISRWVRPNGLVIDKVRVPIGVIAMIYEARPNVTVDAAALCFKASNAVILRGGRESFECNKILAETLQAGGAKKGLPENAIQLVQSRDHAAVGELVKLEGLVDLVIPRGGERLIRAVAEEARVPVIKHYKGVCHVYVDRAADQEKALAIIENGKCSRPGVCNALEKVLVDREIAAEFLPKLGAMLKEKRVEIRGDAEVQAAIPWARAADEEDWDREYLDLVLAVAVVGNADEAIEWINAHGSHHSDCIVTEDEEASKRFSLLVDSACVYTNASTRFTDGGEFGMGAEIGISTDKLHARGPMGVEELSTYKYVVRGKGQVR
jgi:glutamate-5-semialdehyde dehydrogenase